jgi:uncharacterized protein with beta-barrel porin domain
MHEPAHRLGLLLSTSVTALLVGGGAPAAFAACYTGPFPFTNNTTRSCITVSATSFTGNVVNSATGVISPGGPTGILVTNASTITGQISNAGTISVGGTGILVDSSSVITNGIINSGTISASTAGIVVNGVSTFAGGISNSGTISATGAGIVLSTVSTFSGGISNSGTISAGSAGIVVTDVATFSGGVTNSGTISAAVGISVGCFCGISTFSGGIVNSGTISAGTAGILVNVVSAFSGGITNSGTIAATGGGIVAFGVFTFAGGITNSGTISASTGIVVTTVETFAGGISNAGMITAATGIVVSDITTFAGGVSNSGTIAASHTGILVGCACGVSVFSGGINNSGTISAGLGIRVDTVTTFLGGVVNTGMIAASFAGISVGGVSSFGGGISNAGVITLAQNISSAGISIDNVSLFSGGVTNSGTITGAGTGVALGLCGCGISTFTGGITNTGLISARLGILVGNVTTFSGGISNAGTINAANTGILVSGAGFAGGNIVNTGTISGGVAAIDLTGALNTITIEQNAGSLAGAIKLSSFGDTLNIRGGGINGNIVGQSHGDTINFALGAGTFTYGNAFGFSGISQVNVNSGTVILNGANSATHIAVNAGMLQVGDAAHPGASLTGTVDVFGTLSGHGTVLGGVIIEHGGTLVPGGSIGTLTMSSSLTFQSGSFYAVQIAPGAGNSASTAVSGAPGTATINGGTVVVSPQFGHYNATTYTIVSATGGRSGTFAGLTFNFGGPLTFSGTASLSYDPNNVFLNLSDGFIIFAAPGANTNQQNVLNGINNFITGGGTLPPQFFNLINLSGPQLLNALGQFSGETNAGFFPGAFQSGNSFLNLMVNPFLDGRFGNGGGFGPASGFAAEERPALPEAAAAFASAVPVTADSFDRRFRVWGAAYGGSGRVNGDAVVGSHTTNASTAAFAAGVDYLIAPTTTVGFALAGGGTNWGLDQGFGGGRSDMFQAGVYGSHRLGAAYVSGALAYNFHDVTTNRTITVAGSDTIESRFTTNGLGARIEGGYRLATEFVRVSPYAAVQVQSIFLPNRSESATSGSPQFALNFASQTATTTRSELGAWLDRSLALDRGALITLYGRAAWAHDFGNSPSASAIFQALPGSNFIVNGAVPARDGALLTAGAQYRLMNGWSFLAKFDGEFSSTTSIYSGTGMVKKIW